MNSKRLLAIASLIDKDDILVDIGCDHAYLDIFLVKNNLCKRTIASDVAVGALKQAEANIRKHKLEDKIQTILSDGLNDINDFEINTIVISGMGASTILNILSNQKVQSIKKIIIQSNNNLEMLRSEMQKRDFKIVKEIVVLENKKYYTIIKYVHGRQHLSYAEKLFGTFNTENKKYYNYLYKKNNEIISRIPKYQIMKLIKLKYQNLILKIYTKSS